MSRTSRQVDSSPDSELGKLIRQTRAKYSLVDEIARKFSLAGALEPLSDKPGCTTRSVDCKDSKRLEFFIAAAINSGSAIRKFVEYLESSKTIQGSYEFLVDAVVMSKFNRYGGKINQGLLEAIFPIIAAQVLYYKQLKGQPFDIFERATELLKRTNVRDVADLIKAKEIGNVISGVEKKYPVRQHQVKTVYEYYLRETAREEENEDLTSLLHNQQFINGFDDIQSMLTLMKNLYREPLLKKIEAVYRYIRVKYHQKIGPGLAADHCAVCLYLYLALFDHRTTI